MLEALVNLASTDALAADVLALSETFHCTPLEVFKTMTDAACVIAMLLAFTLSWSLDILINRALRLFRKLRPRFSRVICRFLKV